MYGDPGLMQLDWTPGCIYFGDSRVNRHYHIFIISYYPMTIHTMSVPSFGLTRFFQYFVDPHGCIVSFLHIFPTTLSYNLSFLWTLYKYRDWCGGMLLVDSVPVCSGISPQRPPSGSSLSPFDGRIQVLVQLCSTVISGQIDCMYMYRKI